LRQQMLGRCAAHASRNSHYQKHAFLLILVLPLNANPRSGDSSKYAVVGKNDVAQPIDGDDQQALDSGKSRGERGWIVEICLTFAAKRLNFCGLRLDAVMLESPASISNFTTRRPRCPPEPGYRRRAGTGSDMRAP
jgi:hypothetical protein